MVPSHRQRACSQANLSSVWSYLAPNTQTSLLNSCLTQSTHACCEARACGAGLFCLWGNWSCSLAVKAYLKVLPPPLNCALDSWLWMGLHLRTLRCEALTVQLRCIPEQCLTWETGTQVNQWACAPGLYTEIMRCAMKVRMTSLSSLL